MATLTLKSHAMSRALFLGVNDEQDVFLLQALRDADGNGSMDAPTLRTCFTTAPDPAYFVYAAVARDTWYFLDARHQDIRVARDTTARTATAAWTRKSFIRVVSPALSRRIIRQPRRSEAGGDLG